MALSTKFFYEIDENIARIQFYTDDVLTNEWVASNGDEPTMVVPTSPGTTITREEWIAARVNIKRWMTGITASGLYFDNRMGQSDFKSETEQDGNILKLEHKVNDINGVERILRELEYDKTTDQITLAARGSAFTIYWVDYLHLLSDQDHFESLVNKFYNL